jgi:hypothetical protein
MCTPWHLDAVSGSHPPHPLWADTVEKVENDATAKISLRSVWGELTALCLGKGKEVKSAGYRATATLPSSLEERKPDNLHCEWEGVVEQPYQDRENEMQDPVCEECDTNQRNDNHIVEATAGSGLCRPMPDQDNRSWCNHSGLKNGDRAGAN